MSARTLQVALVLVLVALAGCAAPMPDSGSAPETTEATTVEPTTTTRTTANPTPETALVGTITDTSVEGEQVVATISVANEGTRAANASVAIRYVENDSFAKVGTISVPAGGTEELVVGLPTFGDEPESLTVQFRIDGRIVAERPASQ
jgi:hypothetical protein